MSVRFEYGETVEAQLLDCGVGRKTFESRVKSLSKVTESNALEVAVESVQNGPFAPEAFVPEAAKKLGRTQIP